MLKNRPVVLVLLSFTAGVAMGLFFDFWIFAASLVLIWSTVMLIRPCKRWRIVTVLSIIAIAVGFVYSCIHVAFSSPSIPENGKVYTYYAYVKDVRELQSGGRITAQISDGSSQFDGKSVYIYNDSAPKCGSVILVEGVMSQTNATSRGDGIDYYVHGSVQVCEDRQATGFFAMLAKARNALSNSIIKSFPQNSGGFYSALITGDRSRLDTETNALFSRAGISHIIAISGQHYSIIIFSIYALLRKTLKKRNLCSMVCIVLSVVYTLLVGASPSVVRACIMCCAAFAANLFFSRYDTFTALTGALALIVAFSPYSVASVGLQLSFLATAGVVIAITVTERKKLKKNRLSRLIRGALMPLWLSIAATLACLPVFLVAFDYISVIGPITNVIINILITPAMVLGILFAIVLAVFPTLSVIAVVPDLFFSAMVKIARFSVSLPWATVSAYLPYLDLIVIPSVAALVICTSVKKKAALRTALACVLATAVIVASCLIIHDTSMNSNGLIQLYSNKGDSYIFSANNGKTLMIDISGNNDCSETVLKNGFTELDYYISLNWGEDSLYRLNSLLYYINVDTLYIPIEAMGGELEKAVLDKIPNAVYFDKDTITIEGIDICVPTKRGIVGDYIINAKCNSTTLSVMGSCESVMDWAYEDVDGLIISDACIQRECVYTALPKEYDTLYMPDYEESVFTSKLTKGAETVSSYKSRITLRYGKDGIVEVD